MGGLGSQNRPSVLEGEGGGVEKQWGRRGWGPRSKPSITFLCFVSFLEPFKIWPKWLRSEPSHCFCCPRGPRGTPDRAPKQAQMHTLRGFLQVSLKRSENYQNQFSNTWVLEKRFRCFQLAVPSWRSSRFGAIPESFCWCRAGR